MNPLRIVLYGHSVLLDTLATGLRRFHELEVISLAAPLPGAELPAGLRPDVILFDVGAVLPPPTFALLHHYPTARLIGLDADHNRAIVWSAQQLDELSLGDLVAILAGRGLEPAVTVAA